MNKKDFSIEELSAWEALEIKGGFISGEASQNSCINGSKGCGTGISQPGCSNRADGCGSDLSQNGCANSANCGCQAPPGGQDNCVAPPPSSNGNC